MCWVFSFKSQVEEALLHESLSDQPCDSPDFTISSPTQPKSNPSPKQISQPFTIPLSHHPSQRKRLRRLVGVPDAARLPRGAMEMALRNCFSELVFTAWSEKDRELGSKGIRKHLKWNNVICIYIYIVIYMSKNVTAWIGFTDKVSWQVRREKVGETETNRWWLSKYLCP